MRRGRESEHDCYGAGHAGTAMSSALGMAVGRDMRGSDENVVVVAGDAAFTCGVTYEGLNNAADQTKRFIVVLNDNEWSIARNGWGHRTVEREDYPAKYPLRAFTVIDGRLTRTSSRRHSRPLAASIVVCTTAMRCALFR